MQCNSTLKITVIISTSFITTFPWKNSSESNNFFSLLPLPLCFFYSLLSYFHLHKVKLKGFGLIRLDWWGNRTERIAESESPWMESIRFAWRKRLHLSLCGESSRFMSHVDSSLIESIRFAWCKRILKNSSKKKKKKKKKTQAGSFWD